MANQVGWKFLLVYILRVKKTARQILPIEVKAQNNLSISLKTLVFTSIIEGIRSRKLYQSVYATP